jgi:hypothetical protein
MPTEAERKRQEPEDEMTTWLISVALALALLLLFVSIDRVRPFRNQGAEGRTSQPETTMLSRASRTYRAERQSN